MLWAMRPYKAYLRSMIPTWAQVPLKAIRKVREKLTTGELNLGYDTIGTDAHGQAASDLIKEKIESGKPLMVARWGANEILATVSYFHKNKGILSQIYHFVRGDMPFMTYDPHFIQKIAAESGIFPQDGQTVDGFGKIMLQDSPQVDILGSWISHEKQLMHLMPNAKTIPLLDLEPYRHKDPWMKALKGKKVLVVHPFEGSIRKQYAIREKLFENPDVLPEFELKTVKAVQAGGNNTSGFKSFFEALDWQKAEMDKQDYDIALIGCGGFGYPLAAHAKRQGKQAIHIGGSLQLMFGIYGHRWLDRPESQYFNEYWVKPSPDEVPDGAKKIENAAYF